MIEKITIIRLRRPVHQSLNEELQWFGHSLGLFNLRDKDKSCFRIFIELLKASKTELPLSSDELAYSLSLTRGTVVHHINKLIETGLVTTTKKRYVLREPNLEVLLDKIKNDFEKAHAELRAMAKEIDDRLGL